MTIRLLSIGNSHLAALQSALLDAPELWPGLKVAMVGGAVGALNDLRFEHGHLTGASDRARARIVAACDAETMDLRPFDAILIVGAQLGVPRLAEPYRSLAWPGTRGAMQGRILVSRSMIASTCQQIISNTAAVTLARRIRSEYDLPLYVASQPRTSARIATQPAPEFVWLRDAVKRGDGGEVSAQFEAAANHVTNRLGATYLPQPAETIQSGVLTKDRFTRGARRMGPNPTQQPAEDVIHANADYGQCVLNRLAAALGKSCAAL